MAINPQTLQYLGALAGMVSQAQSNTQAQAGGNLADAMAKTMATPDMAQTQGQAQSGAAQPSAPATPTVNGVPQQPQAGYGQAQEQPQSSLGNTSPAQMPAQAINQGAEAAQTPTEKGFFNTLVQNLSGRMADGSQLTGEALQDFQYGHTLGGFLGALGGAIGGDTTGGRLGQAVYQQAAGGLAANNAERREMNTNQLLQAALQSSGKPSSYTPQTNSPTGTGGLSSLVSNGESAMGSLKESLDRIQRLNGIKES